MRDPRSPPAMTTNPSRTPLTALLLLLCGSLGFAAAWVLAMRALDTHAAWLAPLAALDAVLMLRLGRASCRGNPRCGWARPTPGS